MRRVNGLGRFGILLATLAATVTVSHDAISASVCDLLSTSAQAPETVTVQDPPRDALCDANCAGVGPAAPLASGAIAPVGGNLSYVDQWHGACEQKINGKGTAKCKRDTICLPGQEKFSDGGVWKCRVPSRTETRSKTWNPQAECRATSSKLPPAPPPPPPPPPPKTCAGDCSIDRRERGLVVVNEIVTAGRSDLKSLYQFLEVGGKQGAQAELGASYAKVLFAENTPGSSSGVSESFYGKLAELESDKAIKAIDVIIVLHGADQELVLDGPTKVTSIAWAMEDRRHKSCGKALGYGFQSFSNEARTDPKMLECKATRKAKLRALHSTACFGESHASAWKDAGFRVVSGAKKVHADSPSSYPAFLGAWRNGYSFKESVDRANASDPYRKYDRWAENLGFSSRPRHASREVGASVIPTATCCAASCRCVA